MLEILATVAVEEKNKSNYLSNFGLTLSPFDSLSGLLDGEAKRSCQGINCSPLLWPVRFIAL